VKKLFLIVLFLLSTIVNSSTPVTYTKKEITSSVSSINNNWILIKNWTLTNNKCNGCTSLWYTIYRSAYRDSNGYYTFLIYFQSASIWDNGYNARTEYRNLNFLYDNRIFHSNKWGIIGYTEETQQVFTLRLTDGNQQNRLSFKFETLKHN